jgi:ribokinase
VDTTAAGDTFCGVLVASLRSQAALPQGLRRAAAAAALATTRAGAQASIPTYEEVEALMDSVPDNQNDPARSDLRAYCGLQHSKLAPAD